MIVVEGSMSRYWLVWGGGGRPKKKSPEEGGKRQKLGHSNYDPDPLEEEALYRIPAVQASASSASCPTSAPSLGSSTATLLTRVSRGHHNKTTIILHLGYRAWLLGGKKEWMRGIKCKKMPSESHSYIGNPSPRPASKKITIKMSGTQCEALTIPCASGMKDELWKGLRLPNEEDSYK